MDKMGFWEYTYYRNFHPAAEIVLGLVLLCLIIVTLPITIPYMLWHKYVDDYKDYNAWFDSKNKD